MIKIIDYSSIIKEKRVKMGLTQKDLAEKVGVSQPFINKIEVGKKTPSIEMLCKIFGVLEIRVSLEDISEEKE